MSRAVEELFDLVAVDALEGMPSLQLLTWPTRRSGRQGDRLAFQREADSIDGADGASSGGLDDGPDVGVEMSAPLLAEAHALCKAYVSADTVGSSMVVVDAIDDRAAAFYAAHGFTQLGASSRLVIAMRNLAEFVTG